MKNSGFRIVDEAPKDWTEEEDLIGIMRELNFILTNNNNEFRVRYEQIQLPLKKSQGSSCYIFCNVIQPTYMNGVKRQILDVVYLWSLREDNQMRNANILFHKFAVDEILSISFYAQTPNGERIKFSDPRHPLILHLSIESE